MTTRRLLARVMLGVAMTAFGLASPVHSQECPEWIEQRWIGYPSDMSRWLPKQIEVSAPYVFLGPSYGAPGGCKGGGYGDDPIAIADVSDPDAPRIVGEILAPVMDFVVSGDRLVHLSRYCLETAHMETLNITNVSDPSHPTPLLEDHRLDAHPWAAIAASNDTVYVATDEGLSVLDVSVPAEPVESGFLALQWGQVSDMVTERGFLYAASPGEGLRVIQVGEMTNPELVGSWASGGEARDLEVVEGLAFVADGVEGLKVIDATEPGAPELVGILETPDEATRVAVSGSVAAVVLGDSGILIVDVSDPAHPEAVGRFETWGTAVAVGMLGNTAYVSEMGHNGAAPYPRFWAVDLSVPASPVVRGSFGYQSTATDVAAVDGLLFVATGDNGLAILDHDHFDTPGFAFGVTMRGDHALVADGHKGLRIIDVSNPDDMVEIGFVDTPGEARRVAVDGDLAFVADGDRGLRVIDISEPSNPVEIGMAKTSAPALDVAVWRHHAYVIEDDELWLVDVSEPAAPIEVSPLGIRGNTLELVFGNLYVGSGDSFSVWDVWDPSDPQFLGSAPITNEARDIEISGQYAYVAIQDETDNTMGGVAIFDVWNRRQPLRVGEWWGDWILGGESSAAAAAGGRIYLAAGRDQVHVLEASCLNTYWVGVVAHNDGAAGSRWRSDVIISHHADHPVAIEFILHTEDQVITADASVGPRSQGVFEDVVGLLGYEGSGALEIRARAPVNIISRIYSQTSTGTSAACFRGYRSPDGLKRDESVWLYGLRQQEGEYRTNLNFTNAGTEPASVVITLFRSNGEELVEYYVHVDPGLMVQDPQPFKNRASQPDLGWGFANVWVDPNTDGPILVSATVIDSRTNAPTTVPMIH